MDRLNPSMLLGARASLVALWLSTAVVSALQLHGRSEDLLLETTVPAGLHATLINGGAMLDAVMGFALWRWHRPLVYKLAAASLLAMTLVATMLLPSLWLDPLGSLAKNLPIAMLLRVLHGDANQ